MVSDVTPLSGLQAIFDSSFGKGKWVNWEPETLLFEISPEPHPLLREKILVLQVLNQAMNEMISLPEFFIWTVSICNNEPAEFEHVYLPTSLEVAWALVELKKIGEMIGKPFKPTPEFTDIVKYFMQEDGITQSIEPFEFVSETLLEPGPTMSDLYMKKLAVGKYVDHMSKLTSTETTHV